MKYIISLLFVIAQLCLVTFYAHASTSPRLVIAGGSLTEIAFALGAQDDIVAVDTSSHFPREAHALPKIGYFRTLNVEGLLSVEPSHILLLEGSGPSTVINQLEALGVDMTLVKQEKTINSLYDTIKAVGDVVNRPAAAQALVSSMQAELAAQRERLAESEQPQAAPIKALFLMTVGERGLMAAGSNTVPNLIFDELKVQNIFADLDGFKPVSSEALLGLNPDFILLASHTTRGQSVEDICDNTQLQLWAAQRGCQLHKVDSLKYLGLTPRLVDAIDETQTLLQ